MKKTGAVFYNGVVVCRTGNGGLSANNFMIPVNFNLNVLIIDNAFGQWLAEQRKAKFWRQCDLAEESDVSQNSVSRWETGAAFPSRTHLQKIAELFGMTVQEIYMAVLQPAPKQPVPDNKGSTEYTVKEDPESKPPEERIRELETELRSERAKIINLEERNRMLINAMAQFIDQISK